MSKFFASVFAFLFVVLVAFIPQCDLGGVLLGLMVASLISGTLAIVFLQIPTDVSTDQMKLIWKGQMHEPALLIQELFDLASVVRREGLLGAENIRRNIKDEKLRYLTKRLMDGYEKKNVLQWVHNQRDYEGFWIQQIHQLQERVVGVIPGVGVLMVLVLLVLFLVSGQSNPMNMGISLLPFAMAIGFQLIFNAATIDSILSAKVLSVTYFRILEEGLMGISEGINAEFLREQLIARLGLIQKKVE